MKQVRLCWAPGLFVSLLAPLRLNLAERVEGVALGILRVQSGCWAVLPPGLSLAWTKQNHQARLEWPHGCWKQNNQYGLGCHL